MARSQIRGTQIGDDSLTGADLNYKTGIYDETHTYNINDRVCWGGNFYVASTTISGGEAGDLSYAPGTVSGTGWTVSSGITYHNDLLDRDALYAHPITSISGLQDELNSKATLSGLNNHIVDYTNPHNVTKSQVGLSNVDNTSDLNKPISTATQTALDNKLGVNAKAADSDLLDGHDSSYFSISTHSHDLDDLNDVSVSNPQDGEVLTYNSSSGDWEASSAGGVTVHNNLTGRSANDAHPISAITGLQDKIHNQEHREPKATGLIYGGKITKGTGNLDVNYTTGSGIIVDAQSDLSDLDVTEFSWSAGTHTITGVSSGTLEMYRIYVTTSGVEAIDRSHSSGMDRYTKVYLSLIHI